MGNVFASSSKQINIECAEDFACFSANLHVENADNVLVIGDNGEYGMEDMNIYATNARYFELICVGSAKEHGCTQSNIYLPATASHASIQCYGYGCDNLYFYAAEGMDALAQSNLLMNACGVCADETDCVSLWYIHCNVFDEIEESFDHFVAFDGDSCFNEVEECGCSQNANLLSSAFVDDAGVNYCAQMDHHDHHHHSSSMSTMTTDDDGN